PPHLGLGPPLRAGPPRLRLELPHHCCDHRRHRRAARSRRHRPGAGLCARCRRRSGGTARACGCRACARRDHRPAGEHPRPARSHPRRRRSGAAHLCRGQHAGHACRAPRSGGAPPEGGGIHLRVRRVGPRCSRGRVPMAARSATTPVHPTMTCPDDRDVHPQEENTMPELPPEPTEPLNPEAGTISIGIVGAGQCSRSFATLWDRHPNVSRIEITDLRAERAEALAERYEHASVADSFEQMLDSDLDAVAIFTQRWTHAPLVLAALEAGKHVYSAVPMATELTDIEAIIAAVERTGLTYMMGETSYYSPATVFLRRKIAEGALGRVFYSEGDYVHDMDLGFYDAYAYSGGENWKATASYPPMLYPTHAIGGVLGALPARAVSV